MSKINLSVMPVDGGFAVAVDRKATGQVYSTKPEAVAQVAAIKAEASARILAAKEQRKAEKQAKKSPENE